MRQFTAAPAPDEITQLVEIARAAKQSPRADHKLGQGRTLLNVFFNPSLRTRLSTEIAGRNLGMEVITMDAGGGWKIEFEDGVVMDADTAEHIREAAGVMSQYADILAVRSFPGLQDRDADYADTVMQAFARYASVPVVSLESAIRHPLQSLADCVTIAEYRRRERPRVVLTWAPHPRALPQAVPNSFAEWMLASEVELVITHPEGYELDKQFTEGATITHDQSEALRGADFVYAKNWSSYQLYGQILGHHPDWMITPRKMGLTNDAYFMHCLPVRRNVVVADAVLDSDRSLVLQQARNRVFAAQAVLKQMLLTNG
ncbi:MAG: N-acetylornithine carbamoyltransferase [Lewinella sp.]|nr:N-acetylornithine carbamoyltransferase [Lewinella sp.]